MKKYFLLLLLFIAPILRGAEDYYIEIDDHFNYFELLIESTINYPVCHYLKPSEIFLELPRGTFPGRISLCIESDDKISPLIKPGPDIGCVEFSKGICLPKIDMGNYDLVINGEYYGIIYVEKENTYFRSYFEL